MTRSDFVELIVLAAERGALRKIVFSKPKDSEVKKVSGRLVDMRGRAHLSLEYSLPGDTVSQKNLPLSTMAEELSRLMSEYAQANLITSVSDAEYKLSKRGEEVYLGADKLKKRLADFDGKSEIKIESIDKEKNYILTGQEKFLFALGISDKNGRIHDKKQGKFRQINRFLEHIEAVYGELSKSDELLVYDLCCGKSYLSFAVYYYLTEIKGRKTRLLGIDLKRDVIDYCARIARECGFSGMQFVYDDVKNTPKDVTPDMVISLHACDIATDVVINTAADLGARVILSTPCCHRYLNGKVTAEALSFVTRYPHLSNKLCEALTDSLRAERLRASGYSVTVCELTDPENTPKNTLIRAIKKPCSGAELERRRAEYDAALAFIMGEGAKNYLQEI